MYINANWLRQPQTGIRGLNVDIYRNPGLLLDGSKDSVGLVIKEAIRSGGKAIAKSHELKAGQNWIDAYLDLVFEDEMYDFDRIKKVLEEAKKAILDDYVPAAPLPFCLPLANGKQVLGVFGTNLGVLHVDSAEIVFRLLSGAITMVLEEHDSKLKGLPETSCT